jgi:hypothetical protein
MSDCLYFFPIYLRDGKKLSEWSLKFKPHDVKWGNNFILQKSYRCNFPVIAQIFLYNCLLPVQDGASGEKI